MIVSGLFHASLLAFLLTLSHGILKWVSQKNTGSYLQLIIDSWWKIGLAIGLYVFIFFYYTYILRTVHINILYPIYTGLSIVLVFLMGAVFFKEPVSGFQIIGVFVILLGIGLVSGVIKLTT